MVHPDTPVDDKCYYGLGHLASIYVAADKYHIPILKQEALSAWEERSSDANDDILWAMDRRPVDSQDRATEEEWRREFESYFNDLTKGVEILLEHTCDDDDIRESLLTIEWARFALEEHREHWLSIVERWPGYAVDLMKYQAEDEWVMSQAQRMEQEKEAAAKKEAAAAAKKTATPAS